MKVSISIKAALRVVFMGLLCTSAVADGQNAYPSKPIKIVVPFPPGGASTDGLARAFAQKLAKEIKANIVVENKPGAGTAVGALAVKGAPADGYTMLFQSDGLYNAKLTNSNLAYEPGDFEIISALGQTNYAFIVPAVRGWNKLEDLKSVKKELDIGSLGIGVSAYSILADRMTRQLGDKHRMIPYKGGVEGVSAVIAGEIDGYFATIGLSHTVKDNPKVKILAYSGSPGKKSLLPGIKTFHEQGFQDVVFNGYYGLAIRSNTPEPIKEILTRAVRNVVDSTEMKKAREKLNIEDYVGNTEDYKRDVLRIFKLYENAIASEAAAKK